MPERYRDRRQAGKVLAEALDAHGPFADPVILALPRGGLPVGAEVASALGAPLEAFIARKVGAPGQPELGIGAVAEGGTLVVDEEALELLGISPERFDRHVEAERAELARRVARYREGRPLPALADRCVVLVDDGLATGVTAEASLLALHDQRPRRLLLAVPVGAPESVARLGALAEVVCPRRPADFLAVGRWYEEFEPTTDDEVLEALGRGGTKHILD